MQQQYNNNNQSRGGLSRSHSGYSSLDDTDKQNLETTPPRSPRSPRGENPDKKPTFWNKVGGAFAKSGVVLKQAGEKMKEITIEGAGKIKETADTAVAQVKIKLDERKSTY
jgi:hypothetical protein